VNDDLERAGRALDEAENALLLGGSPSQTISFHATTAAASGQWWGRALCWWMSMTVHRDHCGKTLRGEPMSVLSQLSAFIQMTLVAGTVIIGVVTAIPFLLP
jgi:hypothetical protein